MANGNRAEQNGAASTSVNDALLCTTMCMIDRTVDVHVKDGSVYSGTFYTANVENHYAIVLKNARRIKKGDQKTNVADDKLIDTLVIMSDNLVQIVAKKVLSPAEGVSGRVGEDCVGVGAGKSEHDERLGNAAKHRELNQDKRKKVNHTRHLDPVKNVANGSLRKTSTEGANQQRNGTNFVKSGNAETNPSNERQIGGSLEVERGVLQGEIVDDASLNALQASTKGVLPKKDNHDQATMESKLNPGAQLFSPSLPQSKSVTPSVSPAPSMNHSLQPAPVVPIAPAKFATQSNLHYVNGRGDIPYAQHVVGPLGSIPPAVRYAGQYSHHQTGTPYAFPSAQTVMAARRPLIYVHPVSNNGTQGAAVYSQLPSHPMMAPPDLPKHQASMQGLQFYAAHPVANGQQTYGMPAFIPALPPPVFSVPGLNYSYSTKFA